MECPVCKRENNVEFMTTNAMMHRRNAEQYQFNKCLNCDSAFLTNPVAEDELERYYSKNYLPYRGAKAWGKFQSFVAKSQRKLDKKRASFVAKSVRDANNIEILDVGCGNPSFLNTVQIKTGFSCTGIDFTDKGWRDEGFLNIKLYKTSLQDFNLGKKFDIITLWHYLEHDYHLGDTIDKLFDTLKPGGKLLIEVPDYHSFTARKQKEFWQGWHSPRHITLFSKKGFRILFPQDKWIIRKHLRYGTLDAFTLWWLGKMEKKGIDWSKSMEPAFWPLVFLKVVSAPFFLFEKVFPMGVQLLIVEKRTNNILN